MNADHTCQQSEDETLRDIRGDDPLITNGHGRLWTAMDYHGLTGGWDDHARVLQMKLKINAKFFQGVIRIDFITFILNITR